MFSGNSIRSTLSSQTKVKGIPTEENSMRKFGLNITTCEYLRKVLSQGYYRR